MFSPSLHGLLRGLFYALLLCTVCTLQASAGETGLLWKLEAPGGKVSYLFGTMHSDDARVNDFSPELIEALSACDVFMMETLPSKDTAIFQMPTGNLRDLISAKEWEKVSEQSDAHAIDRDMAMRMKPWLLALVFDLPEPQSPYTQDMQLYGMASSQGKQVLGLESSTEHFAALDSLSMNEQLAMLRAVLKHSEQQKKRDFERLLQAYLKGDAETIAALDERITGNVLPKALRSKMKGQLLDERNARMAGRIVQKTAQQSSFIAVGADHLAGRTGLLRQLRAAGYRLTPIK